MIARLIFAAVLTVAAPLSLHVVRMARIAPLTTSDARVSARTVQVTGYNAGTVSELFVRNDSRVRKGDLLMRIEPTLYLSAVRRAQAQLDAALVIRDIRARNVDRPQSIHVAATETALGAAETQARLQLAAAEAEVRTAVAALELAELNLSRLEVRASVNGYVAALHAGVGDFVEPSAPAMVIVDTDSYHVNAYFAEAELSRIAVGAAVRLRLEPDDLPVDGRVRSIAPMMTVRGEPVASNSSAASLPAFGRNRAERCVAVDIGFENLSAGYRPISGAAVDVVVVPAIHEPPSSWRATAKRFFERGMSCLP